MISQKLNEIYEKGFVVYEETLLNKIKRQFFTDVEYNKFYEEKRKYNRMSSCILRLKNYFKILEQNEGYTPVGLRFTPQEIFNISQAGSVFMNAVVTVELIKSGILKRELHVEDVIYNSYEDIPSDTDESKIKVMYVVI